MKLKMNLFITFYIILVVCIITSGCTQNHQSSQSLTLKRIDSCMIMNPDSAYRWLDSIQTFSTVSEEILAEEYLRLGDSFQNINNDFACLICIPTSFNDGIIYPQHTFLNWTNLK